METRARIAWNLRQLRAARKITQENLAVDANVDRTYISGLERAEFNPSVDLLDRIAAALSVDIAVLFAIPPAEEEAPKPLSPGRKSKKG